MWCKKDETGHILEEETATGERMFHEYDIEGNRIYSYTEDKEREIFRTFDHHHHITHQKIFKQGNLNLEERFMYDTKGNQTHYEQTFPIKYRWTKVYDESNREIYYKNSRGYCVCNSYDD